MCHPLFRVEFIEAVCGHASPELAHYVISAKAAFANFGIIAREIKAHLLCDKLMEAGAAARAPFTRNNLQPKDKD